MAYLNYWRKSTAWPTDPTENIKLTEVMWEAMEAKINSGEIREFGFFSDSVSGYVITAEHDVLKNFQTSAMLYPFIEIVKSEEIVPFERAKEVMRGVWKAQAEQMAAQNQ
jgi:hypothetical protein